MRNLRRLGLSDLLALVFAIAVGNAITIAVFVVLGWSSLPDAGIVSLVASLLAVLGALTLVPTVVIVVLMYVSYAAG